MDSGLPLLVDSSSFGTEKVTSNFCFRSSSEHLTSASRTSDEIVLPFANFELMLQLRWQTSAVPFTVTSMLPFSTLPTRAVTTRFPRYC